MRNHDAGVVTFDLVLVGFGHVAQRFVGLLDEQRAALARRDDLDVRLVGIVTRRHGRAYAPRGLDVRQLALALSRDGGGSSVQFVREAVARSAAAARQARLVVVEATTLDIERGQPAIDHIRAALAGGAHAITVNKGPVAFAYSRLARQAAAAKRRFLFEGAVLDGIPIFNLVREAMPAVQILGFRGVVNSTTNYVLTAMERGDSFGEALAAMQRAGIAEADASLDVDGWDAAAKTAALANVLLGARLTPHTVAREGLRGLTREQVAAARSVGRRLKLVASAVGAGRSVRAHVAAVELPEDDLLARLEGQQNALILRTDLLDEIAIVQCGGGLNQTAYALLADLITIRRGLGHRPAPRRRSLRSPDRRRS